MTPPFRPPFYARGGHAQTLLGDLFRRRLAWTLPAEDEVCETRDGVRLLLRATWQPGARAARPALVVVHGLGGSDASGYAVSLGALAAARGWHVVRMNMRASGDGLALCPLLYHAGLDGDLVDALRRVARGAPRLAVAGFSLGANLALLALTRRRDELPPGLFAAAAVSPPLDLAACAAALERPANRLYQLYYMRKLRRAYAQSQRLRPDRYAPDRARRARTVREFDAAVTAPYGGFRDVDHYYADSSAGPRLGDVAVPTLLLAGRDDPMIPVDSVTRWAASAAVRRELLASGGHVGFVAATAAAGRFWAAERALDFLAERAGRDD